MSEKLITLEEALKIEQPTIYDKLIKQLNEKIMYGRSQGLTKIIIPTSRTKGCFMVKLLEEGGYTATIKTNAFNHNDIYVEVEFVKPESNFTNGVPKNWIGEEI